MTTAATATAPTTKRKTTDNRNTEPKNPISNNGNNKNPHPPTTRTDNRLLLEADLSVSAVDDEAYSALHLASAGGHTDVVRLLLQAGAAPDSSTERNHRPLHLAAQYGHSAVVNVRPHVLIGCVSLGGIVQGRWRFGSRGFDAVASVSLFCLRVGCG